ncbi:MAG: hypothetical protein NXY57DRAFT_1041622 [Lentinula lateritia]|nr:MAG: hypothetical protein NXY57DRAFT_1041622 [Lentinula lateritia]
MSLHMVLQMFCAPIIPQLYTVDEVDLYHPVPGQSTPGTEDSWLGVESIEEAQVLYTSKSLGKGEPLVCYRFEYYASIHLWRAARAPSFKPSPGLTGNDKQIFIPKDGGCGQNPSKLTTSIKVLKSMLPAGAPFTLVYREARFALTFGTKKAKAAIRPQEQNRVYVSARDTTCSGWY